jgi:long-chain acyl-CoA synthetase
MTLAAKKNGAWITYSSKDYVKKRQPCELWSFATGYSEGDRIQSVSNKPSEWNFLDHGHEPDRGSACSGIPPISREEYQYILEH